MHRFLLSQQVVMGDSWARMRATHAGSFVEKLKGAKFSFEEAAKVLDCLRLGPWSEQELRDMGAAVNVATQTRSGSKSKTQTMLDVAPYLSVQDMVRDSRSCIPWQSDSPGSAAATPRSKVSAEFSTASKLSDSSPSPTARSTTTPSWS